MMNFAQLRGVINQLEAQQLDWQEQPEESSKRDLPTKEYLAAKFVGNYKIFLEWRQGLDGPYFFFSINKALIEKRSYSMDGGFVYSEFGYQYVVFPATKARFQSLLTLKNKT